MLPGMKTSAVWLGLAFAPLAMGGQEDGVSDEEVIVADEVRVRTAFYEVAPTYVAASMGTAVRRECAAKSASQEAVLSQPRFKAVAQWLCSGGPLYFVRSVSPQGAEGEDGYVCKGEAEWKYYPADMFVDNEECTVVWYDTEHKKHTLE
jgi:hypothetical protein